MKRNFICLLFMTMMFFSISIPVNAAPEWVTMEETPKVIYQVDKQSINFLGEDQEKSVELWLKIIEKDQPNYYGLAHFFIRENLTYMKKEHTKYSISGAVISSTDASTKGWGPLPAESPVGRITKQLFAEYRENQTASTATKAPAIVVDPQELKKAIEDERIKENKNNDGSKNFYVRDKRGPALFSGNSHYMTADFCLSFDANRKRSTVLNFSIEDSRSGVHEVKEAVTIQVDGKEWVLSPPISSDHSGRSSAKFKFTFKLPSSLIEALAGTKDPVTLKWMYRHDGYWKDHERIIPDKTLHDIQLMYSGITN